MRSLIFLALVLSLAALCQPKPAASQSGPGGGTDILSMTCADFAQVKDEEAPLILAWLDGWIAARTGRETIPPEWIGDLGVLVRGYCASHPSDPLYKALEPVR